MNYSFKTSKNQDAISGTSKLMNILESANPNYCEAVTELYGKLLTAFGEPVYTTKSLEDAYCYVIIAKGDSEHILSIYEGSSGPAIGGKDSSSYDAARELIKYIKGMQPMDHEYEGYYFDGPTKIHRGIVNGKIFCSEVEISFESEEYKQAYKEVYRNH